MKLIIQVYVLSDYNSTIPDNQEKPVNLNLQHAFHLKDMENPMPEDREKAIKLKEYQYLKCFV